MKRFNISSCTEYFCTGTPVFLRNRTYHYQMKTYCAHCNRSDFDEFQTMLSTGQCRQYFNRNITCPEEKCGTRSICIDSHEILNYAEDVKVDFSICYLEAKNEFVYSADFLHTVVIPFETRWAWVVKMAMQVVFVLGFMIFVIIPNWANLIPIFIEKRDWESFNKLIDLRMLCIYATFLAQFPTLILGFWAIVSEYVCIISNHTLLEFSTFKFLSQHVTSC